MQLHKVLAACLLTALVGCAQLGIAPADTFNKKVSAAHTTVATVADTANALAADGKLSKADATQIKKSLDKTLATLDEIEAAAALDVTAAGARLPEIIATLTALQTYLATKGK